jgi:hypothetical protein
MNTHIVLFGYSYKYCSEFLRLSGNCQYMKITNTLHVKSNNAVNYVMTDDDDCYYYLELYIHEVRVLQSLKLLLLNP